MANSDLLQSILQSGLSAHNRGEIGRARESYQHALELAPGHPDALHLLGVALLQSGEAARALDCLENAARKQRNNAAVIGDLAQAYFANQRYDEARETFRKASRLDPRNEQFQLGVANSLAIQGKLNEAETLLRRLADRYPQAALVRFNLGNVLRDRGRSADAIDCYRKAMNLDAHLPDARNNLANVLHKLLRFDEAEREYRACIQIAPDYLLAHCNLAAVIIDLGRFSEAEALCRAVIRQAPGFGLAHSSLAAAIGHQGRLLEALESHRTAVKLAPQNTQAIEMYASTLADSGDFSAGMRWFARALAVHPDSLSAHQMMSQSLLAHGCLAEGWIEYGYRPAFVRFREKYPQITLARTLPSAVSGKYFCVLREQGLGDEIFFLRYAPQLAAAGARITYRATNKIGSILRRVASIAQVLEESAPLPPADAVMLAGDLPHALSACAASPLTITDTSGAAARTRNFPSRVSIFWPQLPPPLALTPRDEQIANVRKRLAQIGSPPYLGLTWRGGAPPREQQGVAWGLYKEIDMQLFAATLRGYPGTYIALQRKPAPGELDAFSDALGRRVHDFTEMNEDLENMLALLASIDDYAGVSNTNMHLRAGLGKTARVLVPCPAEWRWMDAGRRSPWFPGFTIYRQSARGDWGPALAELKRDLAGAAAKPETRA